jgi:hypothetical protein
VRAQCVPGFFIGEKNMKKDIYHLFTKYSLSLPHGTIYYNSKKDRLFKSLIDYWKNVRPTDWEDKGWPFDTGVLEDGQMQGARGVNRGRTPLKGTSRIRDIC